MCVRRRLCLGMAEDPPHHRLLSPPITASEANVCRQSRMRRPGNPASSRTPHRKTFSRSVVRSSGNTRSAPSAPGGDAINLAASGPSRIVRGPVLESPMRARAVIGQRADLVPSQVEHFRQPRARERQQAERGHGPGVSQVPDWRSGGWRQVAECSERDSGRDCRDGHDPECQALFASCEVRPDLARSAAGSVFLAGSSVD